MTINDKIRVYEAYNIGVITESDKDLLLNEYDEEYMDAAYEYAFINEQIDDTIYNLNYAFENSMITESEYDTIYDIILEASEEEIEAWKKKYNYDPKTKTVVINGDKRRVELGSINSDSVGFTAKKKKHNNINISKELGKRASDNIVKKYKDDVSSKGGKLKDVVSSIPKYAKSLYDSQINVDRDQMKNAVSKAGKIKKEGIRINNETMTTSTLKELDATLAHEYGHTKDLSNLRKINRLPSVFSKYNYNDIPKEFRGKFLQLKKDVKSGKIDPSDADYKKKIREIENAVINSKGDSDYKLKEAYNKINHSLKNDLNYDSKKGIKGNINTFKRNVKLNDHDKNLDERRADIIAGEVMGVNKKNPANTVGNSVNSQYKRNSTKAGLKNSILHSAGLTNDKSLNDNDKKHLDKVSDASAKDYKKIYNKLKNTNNVRSESQLKYAGSKSASIMAGTNKDK